MLPPEGEKQLPEEDILHNATRVSPNTSTSHSIDKEPDLEPPATAISSRGRVRTASRKLMENPTNSRLKHALGFLVTITTYTLNAPHFAYAEYKRKHFQKSVSFHAKTLHHLEVINMNADSTYNYIHPLSFATSKGDDETYYFHQAI